VAYEPIGEAEVAVVEQTGAVVSAVCRVSLLTNPVYPAMTSAGAVPYVDVEDDAVIVSAAGVIVAVPPE
jgi:hypothetical protein